MRTPFREETSYENIFKTKHLGVLADTLPGYYGLATGSWKHWARVWGEDYDWLVSQFGSQKLMESTGIPVSRWFDGVLE